MILITAILSLCAFQEPPARQWMIKSSVSELTAVFNRSRGSLELVNWSENSVQPVALGEFMTPLALVGSTDRKPMVFACNNQMASVLYLMDPRTFEIHNIPTRSSGKARQVAVTANLPGVLEFKLWQPPVLLDPSHSEPLIIQENYLVKLDDAVTVTELAHGANEAPDVPMRKPEYQRDYSGIVICRNGSPMPTRSYSDLGIDCNSVRDLITDGEGHRLAVVAETELIILRTDSMSVIWRVEADSRYLHHFSSSGKFVAAGRTSNVLYDVDRRRVIRIGPAVLGASVLDFEFAGEDLVFLLSNGLLVRCRISDDTINLTTLNVAGTDREQEFNKNRKSGRNSSGDLIRRTARSLEPVQRRVSIPEE